MPRQIFKKRVIALAGPPPSDTSLDSLKNWISIRKGRFVDSVDEEVTHVLCTHEQFKKRVPLVKRVLNEYKAVHIVHYDWLEFSAVANKRLPERDFSMRSILAKENAERREKNRRESGKREGERGVNPTLFHVYQDREFFSYQVDLTRNNSDDGEFGQRYTLTLWESNAKPHLYWFTAKFMRRKGGGHAAYHRPSLCSGKWRHEMDLFMNFFRLKTGIEWQDRVLLAGTTPLSAFQYLPPGGGKPVGRRLRFSYDCCVELNLECRQQSLQKQATIQNQNEKTCAGGPCAQEEDISSDDGKTPMTLDKEPDFGGIKGNDCPFELQQNREIKDKAEAYYTEPECNYGSADVQLQSYPGICSS